MASDLDLEEEENLRKRALIHFVQQIYAFKRPRLGIIVITRQ